MVLTQPAYESFQHKCPLCLKKRQLSFLLLQLLCFVFKSKNLLHKAQMSGIFHTNLILLAEPQAHNAAAREVERPSALQLVPHGCLMFSHKRHVNVSKLFKTTSYLLISNHIQVKQAVSDTHWLFRTCLMSSSKKEQQVRLLPLVRIFLASWIQSAVSQISRFLLRKGVARRTRCPDLQQVSS